MVPLLIFLFIIIVFLLVTVILLVPRRQPQESGFSYHKNFSLLSSVEKAFLEALDRVLRDDYRVFVKVRLADLLQISSGSARPDQELIRRIERTTVDFVICQAHDLAIVGVIDLDNRMSAPDDHGVDDAFIDKALHAAQLPTLRIPAQLQYDPGEIARHLDSGFQLADRSITASQTGEYGNCPSCGEPLVRLKAKHGENIGKYFLGCSNYPECKYLTPLHEGVPRPAKTEQQGEEAA